MASQAQQASISAPGINRVIDPSRIPDPAMPPQQQVIYQEPREFDLGPRRPLIVSILLWIVALAVIACVAVCVVYAFSPQTVPLEIRPYASQAVNAAADLVSSLLSAITALINR